MNEKIKYPNVRKIPADMLPKETDKSNEIPTPDKERDPESEIVICELNSVSNSLEDIVKKHEDYFTVMGTDEIEKIKDIIFHLTAKMEKTQERAKQM
ncbi:MAG: hypothetical protein NTZ97_00110 [Candidatus Moranbacteria bacterium]|nr:hypothetical protein [Candidatus Moranbacteria bacterium]